MTTQKRAIVALCIISSAMLMWNVTSPTLAYIIKSYPDVAESTVTSILTLPGLVALFVSFIIGPLALKINKKYLLLFAVSTTLVYFCIFVIVGSNGPFTMLLVAACFLGICRGCSTALINSAIAEFLEEEKRAVHIALCSAIMQGVAAVVAVVGGRIAAGNGGADWPIAHYLGFLTVPALIAFAVLMPKKSDDAKNLGDGKLNGGAGGYMPEKERLSIPLKIIAIAAVQFTFVICFCAYFLNSSIYIILEHELGTSADAGWVSSSYTIFGVVIGLTYRMWGKLLGKWIVQLGYALAAMGMIAMLTVTTSIVGIWFAAIMISAGFNLVNPYISSKVISLSPKKHVPIFLSVYIGITNLGVFVAPGILRVMGGLVGEGLTGIMRFAVIAMFCCAIAAVFLFSVTGQSQSKTLPE